MFTKKFKEEDVVVVVVVAVVVVEVVILSFVTVISQCQVQWQT